MKHQMKSVSIIIPNWNGEKQLKKYFPKFIRQFKELKTKKEIIIVDDASSDNSIKILQKIINNNQLCDTLKIRLIKNKYNLGFADSVNLGVKKAKYEIVFLLNTDVEINSRSLEYILLDFSKDDIFAVGANENWEVGIEKFIYYLGDPSKLTRPISKSTINPLPAFWVCGGNSAFNKRLWLSLGGLDSQTYKPFYFEETDLCFRAWKRGYKILWEPRAKVNHFHQKGVIRENFSAGYLKMISERNELLFIWKNVLLKRFWINHIFKIFIKVYQDHSYITSVIEALKKLKSIVYLRKIEEKECKISNEEIFDLFTEQHYY